MDIIVINCNAELMSGHSVTTVSSIRGFLTNLDEVQGKMFQNWSNSSESQLDSVILGGPGYLLMFQLPTMMQN